MLPKIIAILGPTASGKSGLALKLAQKFKGEIISADSRQIYRGFVVGSGLVNGAFKKGIYYADGIPHYLVQFLNPEKNFSAALYKKLALKKISEIFYRKKIPILCGGTGLYIDAVTKNLLFPKIKPNLALRKKLETKTNKELTKQLQFLDPESAKNIDKDNKRRLIRAVEVSILGQASFSQSKNYGPKLFNVLKIGLNLPRQDLYQKIDQRVDQMIENGLVKETEDLLKLYPKTAPAFSGIGYKEVIDYLEGQITKEKMVQKIKFHSHAYARRQITWFKRDLEIHWVKNCQEAEKLVSGFLNSPVKGKT